jgi:hypothetical protein
VKEREGERRGIGREREDSRDICRERKGERNIKQRKFLGTSS